MAELIAAGTTLANSADFTVVAGTPKALFIKPNNVDGDMPSGALFVLQKKTSAGKYTNMAVLNSKNILQLGMVSAPGTFRVQRQKVSDLPGLPGSAVAAGMDIEG